MYSFGVVLFAILTRLTPYVGFPLKTNNQYMYLCKVRALIITFTDIINTKLPSLSFHILFYSFLLCIHVLSFRGSHTLSLHYIFTVLSLLITCFALSNQLLPHLKYIHTSTLHIQHGPAGILRVYKKKYPHLNVPGKQ